MTGPEVFLIIEKGEPYETGTKIPLSARDMILGRSWNASIPDMAFTSLYISRRHAMISFDNNGFSITDLMSKHGTQVNNCDIIENQAHLLRHGDQISLAKGSVQIIFNNEGETDRGETVEFTCASPFTAAAVQEPLAVNLGRREILIDGKPLHLFGKDLDLLLLLYRNRNNAVSYNEIKAVVWPERLHNGADHIPDVGSDEITALVYRLRKRLGRYGPCVISVPRFGYMLDM